MTPTSHAAVSGTHARTDEEAGVVDGVKALIRASETDVTAVEVSALSRISSGFARENWVFTVSWTVGGRTQEKRMILRRDPEASLLDTDRLSEFNTLQALSSVPAVQAPVARWIDVDGRFTGRPSLIMDKIEPGECSWYPFDEGRPLEQRLDFARKYIDQLAAVHSPEALAAVRGSALRVPTRSPALEELEMWTDTLRRHQVGPYPELEFARVWLTRHAPESSRLALVHGDFKPGNMLVHEDRIVALLDWETAHVGDPVEDLGWITNPVRAREHQMSGSWETAQITAYYEEVTGTEVPDAALRFWKAFANYKLAIIFVTGMQAFIDGRESRIYWGPEEVFGALYRQLED